MLAHRRCWDAIAALAVALERIVPLQDGDAQNDPFVSALRRHYRDRKVTPPNLDWAQAQVATGEMTEDEFAWIEEQSGRWHEALEALVAGRQVDTAALRSAADTHRAAVKDLQEQKQRLVRAVTSGQLPDGDEEVKAGFEPLDKQLRTAEFALDQALEAQKAAEARGDVRAALRDFAWRVYAVNVTSGDEAEAEPLLRELIASVKALPEGVLEFSFSVPDAEPTRLPLKRPSDDSDAGSPAETVPWGSVDGDGSVPLPCSSPRATSRRKRPSKRPGSPPSSPGSGA